MRANPAGSDFPMAVLAAALVLSIAASGCGKKAPPPRTGSGLDSAVLGSPAAVALSRQSVVEMSRSAFADTLEAPMRIEADDRRNILVTAPAAGRLESVFPRSEEQAVKQGESLALLSSPELIAAQREYLMLDARKDPRLLQQAESRLARMGLSATAIRGVRASGKPLISIPIVSPKAGFLVSPRAKGQGMQASAPAVGDGMGGGMGSMGSRTAEPQASMGQAAPAGLRSGAYVERGDVLAEINDLAVVAAVLTLPAGVAARFRAGDSVHLEQPEAGYAAMARLDFLESQVSDSSGNVLAWAYVPNPGMRLKLGTLGKAHIIPKADSAWFLPLGAVHDLGERHVVWVRSEGDSGSFRAREIRIGRIDAGQVEVIDGLAPGTMVAANASLLLDPDAMMEIQAGDAVPVETAADPHAGMDMSGDSSATTSPGAAHDHGSAPGGGATLSIAADKAELAGIRTAPAAYAELAPSRAFRAVTRFDSRSRETIAARSEGRITRVLAARPGETVKRGQTLAHLESETLLSAQEEFLATAGKGGELPPGMLQSQMHAARRRLEVLGMHAAQVAGMEKAGKPLAFLPILSPRDGIVLEVAVRPGAYVMPGAVLFTLGNADRIWVETWMLAAEAEAFPEGTEALVEVDGLPGGPLPGRLEHVRQETALSGSVTLAHVVIGEGAGRILPGMQAKVIFRKPGRHALAVRPSALLRSSAMTMLWVESAPGVYSPRMVRTGLETPEGVEVLEGVHAGESVVVAGAYLLNSEWTLRQGAGGGHAGHGGH